MDLLDRLLGHDRWTTAQLLERCRELRAEQWTQPFDLGHQTLAATFQHMIGNVRVYTDVATLARRIADERRWDATYVHALADPPPSKRYGGTIAHVITHNMHHR